MVEGDEWKFNAQREEWNAPEKIYRDEYTSILKAFYESVLRPLVQQGQKIDRNAISMTKSDLEWKLSNHNFKKLPFQIQDAYQRFKRLADALENAKDEEISLNRDVLYGLFSLAIDCHTFGQDMDDLYFQRNPCRADQYKTNSAIRDAEENLGDSELLEAEKGMFDICKKCPYR